MHHILSAKFQFKNGHTDCIVVHVHTELIKGWEGQRRTTKVELEFRTEVHAEHALADWVYEWGDHDYVPTQDGAWLTQEFTDGRFYQPMCSIMRNIIFKWHDVAGLVVQSA